MITRNRSRQASNTASAPLPSNTSANTERLATSISTQAFNKGMPSSASNRKDFGLPSRENYVQVEAEYIASLSQRKREKALLTQEMFDDVWDVLHDPGNPGIRSPQFRFWVRKMFKLSVARRDHNSALFADDEDADVKPVILHEDRPVALKTQIYDILGYCHMLAQHAGRDRTMAKVRELYSWVPKELVAKYVKICPTCVFKKSGDMALALSLRSPDAPTPVLLGASAPLAFVNPSQVQVIHPTPEQSMNIEPTFNSIIVQDTAAQRNMMTTTLDAILISRTLPPLPPPSAFEGDSVRWLSDLTSLPEPVMFPHGIELAPLMRRTESESAASRTRTAPLALPSLMKALSETMVEDAARHPRPQFGVPEAFRIPVRQTTDSIPDQPMSPPIDPVLLRDERDILLRAQQKDMKTGYACPIFATPIELPRKVLIPIDALIANTSIERVSTPTSSTSSQPSSRVSADISLGKMSASASREVGNVSMVSSAGRRSDGSFDAQDWESSYCLDNSM